MRKAWQSGGGAAAGEPSAPEHRLRLALPTQRWNLDFVHDQMALGRRSHVLNVVDDVPLECFLKLRMGPRWFVR
jgi:hypothetical protein